MTLTVADVPVEVDAALRRRAAELCISVDKVAVEAIKAGLQLPSAG